MFYVLDSRLFSCQSYVNLKMAKKILIKIILFILLNLIYCACTDLTLLHRREGIVGRENFTYYKLKSPNAILLILKSL